MSRGVNSRKGSLEGIAQGNRRSSRGNSTSQLRHRESNHCLRCRMISMVGCQLERKATLIHVHL